MGYLLGSWKSVKGIHVMMGNRVFTLPKGSVVAVTQTDEDSQKVLIEMGPQDSDWFFHTMLDNFERCV